MSELGKRGNLGVVNGVIKTAYADGEGGLIIKTETQLDDFINHTKAQYNLGKSVNVFIIDVQYVHVCIYNNRMCIPLW